MTPFQSNLLAELRSGKWRQIYGSYSDQCGGRCAIGVAYEVIMALRDMLAVDSSVFLPRHEIADMSRKDFQVLQGEMIAWNDHQRLPFDAIAARLEDNFRYQGPLL